MTNTWLVWVPLCCGAFITVIRAVEIPNKIIGNAEVDCGEDFIDIFWNTQADFEGRAYAVGYSGNPDCENRGNGRRSTNIRIPKDDCGVTMTRTPQGLFVNFKVMVSFHREFITKADRGFEISCFYMNADKTVTFPLTVSMKDLFGFTVPAEMPQCQYQVLDEETGEEATVVAVGDSLRHKWTCATKSPSLWCMQVKNCFVKDDSGTVFNILDQNGCAVDPFLLNNLEYGTPEGDGREGMHLMASQEAHAFKFADKVVVNFECTIGLSIRDPDAGCEYPQCPLLSVGRRRIARDAEEQAAPVNRPLITNQDLSEAEIEIDVRAHQIDVLDPIGDFGVDSDDAQFRSALRNVHSAGNRSASRAQVDCVRVSLLLVPCVLMTTLLASMLVMVIVLWRHNQVLRAINKTQFD